MSDTENLEYDAICAILKADAEGRKNIQNQLPAALKLPPQKGTPMKAARYADEPPPQPNGRNIRSRIKDIEC